jgi:hypothetical protein
MNYVPEKRGYMVQISGFVWQFIATIWKHSSLQVVRGILELSYPAPILSYFLSVTTQSFVSIFFFQQQQYL